VTAGDLVQVEVRVDLLQRNRAGVGIKLDLEHIPLIEDIVVVLHEGFVPAGVEHYDALPGNNHEDRAAVRCRDHLRQVRCQLVDGIRAVLDSQGASVLDFVCLHCGPPSTTHSSV
jgi:hypothetical protein